MREILFRAKCKNDGKWMDGFPVRIYDYGGKVWEMHPFETNFNVICGVIPETICQFTGLTDKNGKKIFEGDICRFREWSKGEMCWVGKVHWEHQQFMISGGRNKECETMFELCMSRFIPENIEVIGNIHDNSELLENP